MMNDNYKRTKRQRDFYVHRVIRNSEQLKMNEKKSGSLSTQISTGNKKPGESFITSSDTKSLNFVRRGKVYNEKIKEMNVFHQENNIAKLVLDAEPAKPENIEETEVDSIQLAKEPEKELVINPIKSATTNDDYFDLFNYVSKQASQTIDDLPIDVFQGSQEAKQIIINEQPIVNLPELNRIDLEDVPKTPANNGSINLTKKENSSLAQAVKVPKYIPPHISLLGVDSNSQVKDTTTAERLKKQIDDTFEEYGIKAHVHSYIIGSTVILYYIKTDRGYNVEKVASCESDLIMNLQVTSVRIQTPIPGKPFAGIEIPIPFEKRSKVYLKSILKSNEFREFQGVLPIALAKDSTGEEQIVDIVEMPHSLIAGTTKSGKSVCINTILLSLLYRFSPKELRLVLMDPKRVELSQYRDIPHLIMPVVTEEERFPAAITWVYEEMERRFNVFEKLQVTNIADLHAYQEENKLQKIPYIVVIIDEFADWIIGASDEVQMLIQKIAQKARAAGIHIILAAQRPSRDVIKGTIKANFDTRIAFKVSSFDDSKIILGGSGAEKLEGYGDMLLKYAGRTEKRMQGAFVESKNIVNVLNFIRSNNKPNYCITNEELDQMLVSKNESIVSSSTGRSDERFNEVAYYVVRNQNASINSLTQTFGMGFNRVREIVQALSEMGIISSYVKGKAPTVLVDELELNKILEND